MTRSNRQHLIVVHRYDQIHEYLLNFCRVLVRDSLAAGQPVVRGQSTFAFDVEAKKVTSVHVGMQCDPAEQERVLSRPATAETEILPDLVAIIQVTAKACPDHPPRR